MRHPLRPGLSVLVLLLAVPSRASAAATLTRVWPDKMVYRPGENAVLQVDVANDSAADQSVTVVFDLVSLLDTSSEIARQTVSVPGQQTHTVSFAWNTGRRDFGHAAVVSLLDENGNPLDRKEEVFSITGDLWKVALISTVSHFQVIPQDFDDSPTGEKMKTLREGFRGTRNHHGNYYEFFGWAPDDFFELAPEGESSEVWRSGTMGYLMSRRYARGVIQAAHDAGLQVVTYLQPFAMGRRTVEEFRQHPEWFLWDEFGQPQLGFTHQQLAEWRAGKVDLYAPCVVYGSPNLAHRETLDVAIDQIVAAARQYGFDGCRFDNTCYTVTLGNRDFQGHPVVRTQQEADRRTVRALDHLRKRLAKEISPYFAVGHNFAYVVRDLNPVAWDRIASEGWVIVDEMTNRLFAPPTLNPATGRSRPWRDFVRTLQAGRDGAWRRGGHYQMIGFDSDEVQTPNPQDEKHPYISAADATRLYMNILTLASGVHPYSYHYAPGLPRVAEYWKFATRYSAFLWDNRMKPLTRPEKYLSVTAAREVWWQDFAYLRGPEKGTAQTIVHLVNPPLHPIHENPQSELPQPLEQIQVTSRVPRECHLRRAVWLTGDPQVSAVELPVTVAGDRVSVIVPQLELWSLVVFDWQTLSPTAFREAAAPASAAEFREDDSTKKQWIESTQIQANDTKKWTVEAEAYNTICEKVADPEAHNGFALRARKGIAREWYMATATYSYRERFGQYRLTFRVKCSDHTTPAEVLAIGTGVNGAVASSQEHFSRVLKGTDFAASHQYQDFTVDLLRSDVGFLGYEMIYQGGADVWVDSITIERTGDVTDQELAQRFGGAGDPGVSPYPARPLPRSSPRALWVQGLFHEYDPFGAVLEALQIPVQVVEVDQVQSGTVLHHFPQNGEEMAQYSLLLLSDTDPRGLSFQGRALVRAWVEQGGTLVVTGGPFALGKGLTRGTLLEDLYPVTVTDRWDFMPGGTFTPAQPLPSGCLNYRGEAGSYWIHRVTARDGAKVVLRVRDTPVLTYQQVGRGCVVIFSGAALEGPRRLKAYWEDGAWKSWLAEFLAGLG